MSAIIILIAIILCAIFLIAISLSTMARLLRYAKGGFSRAVAIAALWMVMALVAFVFLMMIDDSGTDIFTACISALLALLVIGVEIFCIQRFMKTSAKKALAGWATTMAVRLALTLVILLWVRSGLTEAYSAPTLAMAPTLLSRHAVGVCPRCGGTVYFNLSAGFLRQSRLDGSSDDTTGYCMKCDEEATVSVRSLFPLPSDYFFVTKFLRPERWDIVAFKHGADTYVKRLVALPGEEISIDPDGYISINGIRMSAPSDAPNSVFKWGSDIAKSRDNALTPNASLLLGPDQYFVIGDASERSLDSRTFGPIRQSDLVGVVTWIYWPISRMRVLR